MEVTRHKVWIGVREFDFMSIWDKIEVILNDNVIIKQLYISLSVLSQYKGKCSWSQSFFITKMCILEVSHFQQVYVNRWPNRFHQPVNSHSTNY